jgi:hypothetical protein
MLREPGQRRGMVCYTTASRILVTTRRENVRMGLATRYTSQTPSAMLEQPEDRRTCLTSGLERIGVWSRVACCKQDASPHQPFNFTNPRTNNSATTLRQTRSRHDRQVSPAAIQPRQPRGRLLSSHEKHHEQRTKSEGTETPSVHVHSHGTACATATQGKTRQKLQLCRHVTCLLV